MMLSITIPWMMAVWRLTPQSPTRSVVEFLAGYLLTWTVFSVAASMMQGLLSNATLISTTGVPNTPLFGGVLLFVAGLFQLTKIKERCLAHCQSPLGFFLTTWHGGRWGIIRMGIHHGTYCVGCCWALMLLGFVAGVMNLIWMIGVTIYVFVDQSLLKTPALSRLTGAFLLIWGAWTIVESEL